MKIKSNYIKRKERGFLKAQKAMHDLAFQYVLEFFGNDREKANLWFSVPNPFFGNISPDEMVNRGRSKTVLDFVRDSRKVWNAKT